MLDGSAMGCTGCKSKDLSAVARCIDCATFLCPNCVMAHQFMHCFEGHRVLSLSELQTRHDEPKADKPISCLRHRHEMLRFFCRTCDTPVCRECTINEHKGHEYDYLSEVASREMITMSTMADQAKVKANDLRGMAKSMQYASNQLQNQYHKAQAEVRETCTFYIQMLEERKEEALKELDSAYTAKQNSVATVTKRMGEATEKLDQGAEFIDKLAKHTTPIEGLLFKKTLDNRLGDMMNYMPDVNLSNAFDIEFVSNYQAIQVGVRNTFGYVRQSPDVQQTRPQPIARPNGFSLPTQNPLVTSITSSLTSNLTNSLVSGLSPNMLSGHGDSVANSNVWDPSTLLGETTKFPSSSSLMMPPTIAEPIMSMNQDPYQKWSNAGLELNLMQLQQNQPDVFSTAADPVIDLTSKLITANIYPPKSQIKRQKMIYHCKFGEFGVLEGQFTEPSGVAVNAQGDIVVADTNNHRIQIFDKEGRFKFQFGECGKRDSQLMYPNRVAVVKTSGDIVVTERSPTHQVQIYNQYGQFVRKFGATILQHPRGVTVDNKGRIIIVECKVMRVIIFDQMGTVLHKFGCSKHLEFPNGVVVNDREEIFISDNRAHCVKVFSYQGVFLRQIGGEGITNYPIGVGINSTGDILVADNHNNFNLSMFTQDGQLINALESKVKHAQCFDVALMDDGSIVLASKDYRLYIYRYMQLPSLCL